MEIKLGGITRTGNGGIVAYRTAVGALSSACTCGGAALRFGEQKPSRARCTAVAGVEAEVY